MNARMALPRKPLRPLGSALRAVLSPGRNLRILLPFLLVGVAKALFLAGLVRPDCVPTPVVALFLTVFPDADVLVRYPQLVLKVPAIARGTDIVLFLSVQVMLQAWAMAAFARAWGTAPARNWWSARCLLGMIAIAALLLAVPYGVMRLGVWFGGKTTAGHGALAIGSIVQMMLFAAPAFLLLHGLGLRSAMASSLRLLGRLPLAIPLAVVVLAALHAPTVVLRRPALAAASGYDPDWVLWALLSQIPADVLGAFLAAALSSYFALRTRGRSTPAPRPALALAALLVMITLSSGCGMDRARDVRIRYAAERWIERADRRAAVLLGASKPDSTAWLDVASHYERALAITGTDRITARTEGRVPLAIAKLCGRAQLGRTDAWARAGRHAAALVAYRHLLQRARPYPGVQSDAALGIARTLDRARDWQAAFSAYDAWLRGVADGSWPLHRNGLEIPGYVARRLRARGELATRARWITVAESALEAAATRRQLARAARNARFVLLLEAERWEDAHAALRRMRELHDPTGRDGSLLVAEASLLAGGLGRPSAALGVLAGLTAEKNAFDSQHRVAGWLLAAQIHLRAGDWQPARTAFEAAAHEARSDAGRSEALLGLARVQVGCGEHVDARRTFTQLRELYGNTVAGLRASQEELQLVRSHAGREEVESLLPVVVHHYRRVLQQYGTETPALLAAAALAECFGVAGEWERGVDLLDSLSATLAGDTRSGTLLVRAARISAHELDDRPRARRLLSTLHARYPNSDVAVLARGLADSLAVP